MFKSDLIENFIDQAKKIPGISKKQAEKIVLWILNSDTQKVFEISNLMKKIKENIKFCPLCGNAVEDIENCAICHDPQRDNILLVVENVGIIEKIERAKFYYGKYFVFKQLIKTENDLSKIQNEIDRLVSYSTNFDEIILGISPTLEGEITNNILRKKIREKQLEVSQLAIGLPLGSSLDYIDDITLKLSLIHRSK